MLEIFINNQKVDLPDDIEINLVYENPIFSTDRIPAPYAFDFEIPATPRNLAIAGYPNRLSQNRDYSPKTAKIVFAGRLLLEGFATPEPTKDSLSYSICGVDLSRDIKKKLARQGLDRWGLTPDASSGKTDSDMYNTLLMAHIMDGDFPIVAAPIAIEETETEGGEMVYERYKTLRQAYISPYNTAQNSYLFQSDSGAVYSTGNILPALRVGKLFEALLGERLRRNIFTEGDWRKLVMISNYHPDFTLDGDGAPLRRDIAGCALWMEDLVPDVAANEFITELLKLPCATLFLKGDAYNIEYNKDIITRTIVHDWSAKIVGLPTVGSEPAMTYKFRYSNDTPCEIPPYTMSATSIKNMLQIGYVGYVSVHYPRQTFYCTPTNETRTQFTYKVTNHADSKEIMEADPEDDAPEVYDMQTAAEMLINSLHPYVTTVDAGPLKPNRYIYAPQIEAITDKRDDKIQLSLYHGLCPDVSNEEGDRTYPYLCSSNYDCNGKRIGNLSIEQAALYNEYHKPFAEWLARRRLAMSVDLRLSVHDLSTLDLRDKFHVGSHNFLIKELRATLTMSRIESCDADLIEV